mmetsp:Transcript_1061/g.2653  ORF Transcript_1061/g.2653 Transcript_1061/m.2653 type:complete len:204 (-) Transcript_1061:137-748(-)
MLDICSRLAGIGKNRNRVCKLSVADGTVATKGRSNASVHVKARFSHGKALRLFVFYLANLADTIGSDQSHRKRATRKVIVCARRSWFRFFPALVVKCGALSPRMQFGTTLPFRCWFVFSAVSAYPSSQKGGPGEEKDAREQLFWIVKVCGLPPTALSGREGVDFSVYRPTVRRLQSLPPVYEMRHCFDWYWLYGCVRRHLRLS